MSMHTVLSMISQFAKCELCEILWVCNNDFFTASQNLAKTAFSQKKFSESVFSAFSVD